MRGEWSRFDVSLAACDRCGDDDDALFVIRECDPARGVVETLGAQVLCLGCLRQLRDAISEQIDVPPTVLIGASA